MKRLTAVWSKFLIPGTSLMSMNCLSGWKLMMSAGAKPYIAVTSTFCAAMRVFWALVQVAPCPSISKVTLTFGACPLNLSLIPFIAFWNAWAEVPEFQAMTSIVTGPLDAAALAAGAVVGAAALDAAVVGAAVAAPAPVEGV